MGAQIDHRIMFAEACRSHAATTCSPFRRDHLLVLASLSEQEAELVQQSYDCIAASRGVIALAEILLQRR